MSTASKTPNLGLMSPVGSDPFDPADFAATNAILDQNAGVLVVPNQASRPTGYSSAQHGRMVWQADQNIMWVWNQPISTTAGFWSRQGVKGWLGGSSNAAQINTTAITITSAPVVVSATLMVPGGRPCLILYSWVFIGNSQARYATLNLLTNGSSIYETRHNGNGFDVAYQGNTQYPPQSSMFGFVRQSSDTQASVNFQLKLRCQDPAVVGSAQGGGSAFIINTKLDIIEI